MKFLAGLIFVLPLCAAAQDCKLKKTVDPYTKEVRLSTSLIKMDMASLSIQADSKEVDLFFTMNRNESCFNDASTAVINYEGTKVKATFRNTGSVNCEGFFHIIFRNTATTNTLLNRLITQKITSIVINGTNKTQTTITLTPEDQEKIMTQGDCLVKEAKALIK
ncbi:MAG: hypothetical protein JNK14_18960 [Chitinophagaceae bacterium]|nr:hypothetical protein [Chitinophagaceae bacterium]